LGSKEKEQKFVRQDSRLLATIYDSGIDFYQQRCAMAILGAGCRAAIFNK